MTDKSFLKNWRSNASVQAIIAKTAFTPSASVTIPASRDEADWATRVQAMRQHCVDQASGRWRPEAPIHGASITFHFEHAVDAVHFKLKFR